MKTLSQSSVELVKILNDGQFHDGTSIGKQLNISRAAVWKLIKKLEFYNVPLTCIKGKGYRLDSQLALLDSKQLQSESVKVEVLEKIASTNDYLKDIINDKQGILVCLAETQTAGRGRMQRQWHSPFAENIYLSMRYSFAKDVSELSGLSLVVGLSLCQAIESITDLQGQAVKIKWPNDILVNGGKLAGTLIEMQAESNGFCQVIIGVGVNVNMIEADKATIDQNWTSLAKLTGQYIDRNLLGKAIIASLIDYLERFSVQGLAAFQTEWQTRDCLAGSQIAVMAGKQRIIGTELGINQQGHLKLQTAEGEIRTLSSGETTLLKLK